MKSPIYALGNTSDADFVEIADEGERWRFWDLAHAFGVSAWSPPKYRREPSDMVASSDNAGTLLSSDFPSVGGPVIVASARAMLCLGGLLADHAEFLPLENAETGAQDLGVLMPHHAVPLAALDIPKSFVSFVPGTRRVMYVQTPIFRKGWVLDSVVFRLGCAGGTVFASQSFKDAVETSGLTGLRFSPVGVV